MSGGGRQDRNAPGTTSFGRCLDININNLFVDVDDVTVSSNLGSGREETTDDRCRCVASFGTSRERMKAFG